MSSWLTLQEYSNKQNISISTLRRKIKTKEIEYIFKNGRYLVKIPKNEETTNRKEDYQNLLDKKNQKILSLKGDKEDLLALVNFLEKEKIGILELLKNQESSL